MVIQKLMLVSGADNIGVDARHVNLAFERCHLSGFSSHVAHYILNVRFSTSFD